ncbi:50S ribosomal protein L25 [Clostridium brassicae]|uniref:Large ribosomal subunit protein bL25 n=1 Tax=Clostridium brassicae TaxID=2999072 RepID=A0ABT4DBN0_9CLOT|nr:50S ribosomal protein L25 [Clostridium brassicae]MCY6958641.1 50S ribosomal protein L25 [Clostridium brassicae]
MEILKGEIREKNTNHYPRSRRKQGKVPGILYGALVKNSLFEIGELELNREVNAVGEYGTLNLELNDAQHKALIKEVQRDPVTHRIVHIDLEEVSDNQIVQTEIPIIFKGEGLINKNGGIVQKEKSSIKVQGRHKEIPKSIKINLAEVGIGGVLRASDLEMAREISIVDNIDTVIAAISHYSVGAESEEEEKDTAQAVAKEIHMEE